MFHGDLRCLDLRKASTSGESFSSSDMDTKGSITDVDNIAVVQISSGATGPHIDDNNSPISKLDHDTLLKIFRTNADMDQDPWQPNDGRVTQESLRIMNTTRNSSQVNSGWRSLIIGAPILWACLIDIDFLKASGTSWRNEVIRRTRNAPLHVKGHIFVPSLDESKRWWLNFLGENWSRIRKIDLAVLGVSRHLDIFPEFNSLDYAAAAKFRQCLSFLSLPTSSLEFFRLRLPSLCSPLETGSTLFQDDAPNLIHFEIYNVRFDPRSSWLLQLHTLHIHEFHSQTFKSADALCQALSQMPNLESLSLADTIADPFISDHLGPIHLPRLRYLCIREMRWDTLLQLRGNGNPPSTSSTPFTFWALLDRIIPQIGCIFKIYFSPSYASQVDGPLLYRFSKNYFRVHEATMLDILYHEEKFEIALDRTAIERGHIIDLFTFFDYSPVIQLIPLGSSDLFSMVNRIFDSLVDPSFSRITCLRLLIGKSNGPLLSRSQWQHLLAGFTSVENLTTTSETLDFLYHPQPVDTPLIFPSLKTLKIPAEGINSLLQSKPVFSVPAVTLFLTMRMEMGCPVDTLEYHSEYANRGRILDNLSFLDDIRGLRVVWKTRTFGDGEYICGSGHPEELDFEQRSKLAWQEN